VANSASHASLPYPIKNARFTVLVPYLDADGDPTDPTTPDTEFSLDAGSYADTAEEVTTITGSNGTGYLTFTGAETNGSMLAACFKVASGPKATLGTWYPRVLPIVSSGTLSAGSAGGGTLGTVLAYDVTGCFLRTTGGTGGGGTGGANNQARKIITYTVSTGAFTVAPNWETTPSTDTTYDVLLPEDMSLAALKALNPTTAGRTLDVTTTGEAGLDFANVNLPVGAIPALGWLENGTLQSATASTAVLRSATSLADDLVNGATLVIRAGTGAGQSRVLHNWTSASDTADISPDWTTTPDNTSDYYLIPTPPAPTNAAALPVALISSGTGTGQLSVTSGVVAASVNAAGLATDAVTEIQSGLATASAVSTLQTSVNTIDDFLDTEVAAILAAVDTEVAAIKAVTDNLPNSGALTSLPTAASVNATRYQKNTISQKVFFTLVDSTDHVTRKTGITVTAQRSLDGAAFGSATGTVTEVGNGVYYLSTSAADINADDVIFRFTGTACDAVELHVVTY
jgi:hypothetical protein